MSWTEDTPDAELCSQTSGCIAVVPRTQDGLTVLNAVCSEVHMFASLRWWNGWRRRAASPKLYENVPQYFQAHKEALQGKKFSCQFQMFGENCYIQTAFSWKARTITKKNQNCHKILQFHQILHLTREMHCIDRGDCVTALSKIWSKKTSFS